MNIILCTLLLLIQTGPAAQTPAAAPAPATEQVEVVLYSDFQCPFCAHFARTFRELQTKGVEGVRTTVRFKHFPLEMHAGAPLAHRAALAAGEQGKFWEMHDLLFANRGTFTRPELLGLAAKLGLDAARFQKDLDGERLKLAVQADQAEGGRLGVDATPTFFVNGKKYTGAKSFEQLKQLVQNEQRRMVALSEIPDSLLSYGPSDAPVTLEFFADLQSPVSLPAVQVLDQVARRYPSKVRVQFRNFPLAFHPQAPLAHEAAMAAAAQGRFWEFTRYILDHQTTLREQDLIAQAGRLGMDEIKFAQMLAERRYAPRVVADIEAGSRRGIRGSPVVFVNGNRIDGVPSLEKLVEYVESKLTAEGGGEGAKREQPRPAGLEVRP